MARNGPIEPPSLPPPPPPPTATRIDSIQVTSSPPYEAGKTITVVVLGTPGGTGWWTLEAIPVTPGIGER